MTLNKTHNPWRIAGWLLLLVLTSVWVPSAALAQDPDVAGDLFQRAVEQFEAENYYEAAILLTEAYRYDPNPSLAFNVGRAFERAGRFEEATEYYELALDPADEELLARATEALERVQAAMDATTTDQQVETEQPAPAPGMILVDMDADIDGAFVRIDGGPSAQLPVQAEVMPGFHTVVVNADGYIPYREDVEVDEGEAITVRATLIRERGGSGNGLRITSYALTGVGVAGITMGAIFAGNAQGFYDDAESASSGGRESVFDAAVSDGKSARNMSNIMYGVGFAALAGGVSLFVVSLSNGSERAANNDRPGTRAELVGAPNQVGLRFTW